MGRLILLLAIVVVVYLLIRSYRRNLPGQNRPGQNMPGKNGAVAEDMVRCAQCGVHLPKGESIQANGQFFCGAEHCDSYHK